MNVKKIINNQIEYIWVKMTHLDQVVHNVIAGCVHWYLECIHLNKFMNNESANI